MNCMICFEKNNLIKPCSCNYYVHQKCLNKWILENKNICLICKKQLKYNYLIFFLKILKNMWNNLYFSWNFIIKYDLHNFIEWDQY